MSRPMALAGVLAALAVVVMALGTLLPGATFVCPMVCALILDIVRAYCGRRIGWAWYCAVALLSVLLAPDKEAAGVFLFLGYYPLVKPSLDRKKLGFLWKLLLFNGATLLMYSLLIRLFGMTALENEFREAGTALCLVLLLLGNATFFLLDRILGKWEKQRRRTAHGFPRREAGSPKG